MLLELQKLINKNIKNKLAHFTKKILYAYNYYKIQIVKN